jgi:prepilin-type N-terminal cleavage/methylation domain-containing protein
MKNRAFTLLELLIVLAILGLLLALALAAIGKLRQSAIRTQDANQLRQIGIAINIHHAQKQALMELSNFFPSEYQSTSWQVELLPYLELDSLYGHWHNVNSFPVSYWVSKFVSPLDPSAAVVTEPTLRRQSTPSSYAANYQVFGKLRKKNLDSVTDGVSNTIFVGPHYTVCGIGSFSYVVSWSNSWEANAGQTLVEQRSTFAEYVINIKRPRMDYYPITDGVPPSSDSQSHVTFQLKPTAFNCDPRQLNSGDPSAAAFLMGDGHIMRLKSTVASKLFWAAVTPDAADIVSFD